MPSLFIPYFLFSPSITDVTAVQTLWFVIPLHVLTPLLYITNINCILINNI